MRKDFRVLKATKISTCELKFDRKSLVHIQFKTSSFVEKSHKCTTTRYLCRCISVYYIGFIWFRKSYCYNPLGITVHCRVDGVAVLEEDFLFHPSRYSRSHLNHNKCFNFKLLCLWNVQIKLQFWCWLS